MKQTPYIFTQLCFYIDRDYFEVLVKRYKGNAYVKHFTCWNQLTTMLWAQFTNRVGLRDIECSLRGHSNKLYRLGIGKNVSRNNLSNTNAKRDVAIYRELAQRMMLRASKTAVRDKKLASICEILGIEGFCAIDSSKVFLDLDRFPWTVPQAGHGGIRLHTMYDILRQVPLMALVTGHEERDQTFMDDYTYKPGYMYVLDKAYVKTPSLYNINCLGAWFVVRLKKNMLYEVVRENPLPKDEINTMGDKTIRFTSRWSKNGYPKELRLIQYYSAENNEVICFITNFMAAPAHIIALLYKHRWEIELFFKWIKQHLRIEKFYGTSGNAVMTQIYIAICAYCIYALAANDHQFKGTLFDFSRLISTSLTEKISIQNLIMNFNGFHQHKERQSDGEQLTLFDLPYN